MKLRQLKPVLIILFVGISLCACHPKYEPVQHLEEFTEELIMNSDRYSVSQWKDAVDTYSQIESEIARYADQYDYDERRKIARLEKLCEDQLCKGAGHSVGNQIREIGNRVGLFLDGLNDSLDEMLNQ